MEQEEMEENILRFADLKQILKVGKDKVYDLFKRPDFPSFKIGKAWAVTSDNFWNWLSQYRKEG